MKYTVEYLTEQLEKAIKVGSGLNARLEVNPSSFALRLALRSMNDHIEEIRKDLAEARGEMKPAFKRKLKAAHALSSV
jgi:hypothetical protein